MNMQSLMAQAQKMQRDLTKKKEEYIDWLKQQEQERKIKEDEWNFNIQNEGDNWHWKVFDELVTDTDFIEFGKNHLGWQSQDIKEAIISCGGYEARGFNWFSYLLKDYVHGSTEQAYGPHPEQLDEEMPDFFYED